MMLTEQRKFGTLSRRHIRHPQGELMSIVRRVLCLVLLCCWSSAWAQTTVSAFSPEGQVRRVRQVVARFS